MRRFMVAGGLLAALGLGAGCGVDEELHNKTVADLNRTKQELADCQKKGADQEAEITRLKGEGEKLDKRLTQLGQERGTLSLDLEQAKKRMDELKKAQEAAEKRNAQ